MKIMSNIEAVLFLFLVSSRKANKLTLIRPVIMKYLKINAAFMLRGSVLVIVIRSPKYNKWYNGTKIGRRDMSSGL
jgi:hypothetical protein